MERSYLELRYDANDVWSQRYQSLFRFKQPITWGVLQPPPQTQVQGVFRDEWNRTHNFTTTGHDAGTIAFVRNIFSKIDNIIEPDFVEIYGVGPAVLPDITVISSLERLDKVNGKEPAGYFAITDPVIGMTIWHDENADGNASQFEKHVLVHEIGHALGLDHPNGNGSDPNWSTYDSVMSYNRPNNNYPDWFTAVDIQALVSIWGAESNPTQLGRIQGSNGPTITGRGESDVITGLQPNELGFSLTQPARWIANKSFNNTSQFSLGQKRNGKKKYILADGDYQQYDWNEIGSGIDTLKLIGQGRWTYDALSGSILIQSDKDNIAGVIRNLSEDVFSSLAINYS